ncbi:MAG: Gfo/Idh/MocA family oxidoreductase [Candidatus Sumerlaeaceae bacterium]|nr:Gfo/Idh/MocA family oxidoreductase [Candidatus Sumerlaeaceae bacterium]
MRKLRMGMVGGGEGAFIGAVHRMAASLTGEIELVCGAFSSSAERSRKSGIALGIAPMRAYPNYRQMLEVESTLPSDARMDFVTIVTPNYLHYEIARAALETGFHVLCEKPLTTTLEQALALKDVAARTGRLVGVTFNYTGYPLVKHARHLVGLGALGEVRKVFVEYLQGWLAFPVERDGQKQAEWRTDPERAGAAGCLGDIGTHAFNLAEYVACLRVREVSADLTTFVQGRQVDDDAAVLMRFENGAKGVLCASQVAIDEENALTIRLYGTKGSLEWRQEEPNTLVVKWAGRGREVLRSGVNYRDRLCPQAIAASRLPCGHPEGFIEALANLYRGFAEAVRHHEGEPLAPLLDHPTLDDGVRAMAFVEAALQSSQAEGQWKTLKL